MEKRPGIENSPLEGKSLENKEEYKSTKVSIRLEFFRHDEKAKPVEGQPDTTVRLTPKGRIAATEAGKTLDPQPEVAVSFGSSRERSVETAMRAMMANEKEVGADTTLEDMRELVNDELKFGRKDAVSPNLNFTYEADPEYKSIFLQHYTKDKDGLKWLLEESDDLVRRLGDKTDSSYSRQAGNIAELIKKYLEILPTWQKVASTNPEKYAALNNEMQRFMGSHQTVTESFLMKVIEKTEGRDAVYKFIESLPDKNGFGFSEGFQVKMRTDETGKHITMTYKDKHWELTPQLIEEILSERQQLDESIH